VIGLSKEVLKYSDIEFNPKGDIFSFFRNYLTQKDILDGKIDVLVDKREPAKYGIKLKNMGYNVEYKTLEIGDYELGKIKLNTKDEKYLLKKYFYNNI
jgi:hypothetical protein